MALVGFGDGFGDGFGKLYKIMVINQSQLC